jgi:thiamine phosphate synthase YjbQ (UPF0047 family)
MLSSRSFYVATTRGVDIVNIGHDVRGFMRESKFDKGLLTVGLRLGGGIVVILSTEGRVAEEQKDEIRKALAQPPYPYRYLLPPVLSVPVDNGKMMFEPWQDLFLVDFEPSGRRREVVVQLLAELKEEAKPGVKR